ncbi:GspE/PulE/PilB domain-containing protein [Hyalangium gracile]|uniref:GspE/PulE/PilB domain-containing protein n=1 Tax=Hyalangium gracile TaxID=394092 RepID=UPI001CCFEF66|nr:general secretion pathway protein GspE [Hyalangium gracile]
MRLGELLIQEKLISPQALEEALETQVVQGGRLGTNLLELGMITEKDLARMLGQLHGCAHASGELTPDPQALQLVDLNDADDKDYLPMRVDATRLSVAVINPRDYPTLDAVAFATGKRVVPVIIPEFRMNQLLRRYCKAFRPLRAIDMKAVERPKPAPERHDPTGRLTKQAKGSELISEEEFQSVYAQALTGGARSELINELLEEEEEVITGEEIAAAAEEEEVITGEVVEEEPPGEVYVPLPQAPQPPERPTIPMWTLPAAPAAPPVERPTIPMWTLPDAPAAPPVERPTLPMWPLPDAPRVPEPEQPFASAPPVPDYSLPPVAEPPVAAPPVAAPPVAPARPSAGTPRSIPTIPFIPVPVEPPPAARPSSGFIPVPSDEGASQPAQPWAALPPVAPVVPPVAPSVPPVAAPRQAPVSAPVAAAKPAAAPGKAATRRPGAASTRQPAPKPYSFAEAQAQLAKSLDREDVATTVLRYAVGKWRRCLLLSVQGSLVTGWHGMGRGVRDAAVRRIGVALREQNTFRLVRDTRSHYIGPVRRDTAMNVFYRLLGADKRPEPPFPKTAVILPLLVRGKVVHLLYLDNGPEQLTTPDVGELLILAQSVARSYEEMFRRRKSA